MGEGFSSDTPCAGGCGKGCFVSIWEWKMQNPVFMEHFSRSVGSSRGQSLQITVNVWDQIARTVTLTSHGLKHRALSACGCIVYRVSYIVCHAKITQFLLNNHSAQKLSVTFFYPNFLSNFLKIIKDPLWNVIASACFTCRLFFSPTTRSLAEKTERKILDGLSKLGSCSYTRFWRLELEFLLVDTLKKPIYSLQGLNWIPWFSRLIKGFHNWITSLFTSSVL